MEMTAIKELPQEINFEGNTYCLTMEQTKEGKVTLTYEHKPIREDYFLLGVINDTLDKAVKSMKKYFVIYNISN